MHNPTNQLEGSWSYSNQPKDSQNINSIHHPPETRSVQRRSIVFIFLPEFLLQFSAEAFAGNSASATSEQTCHLQKHFGCDDTRLQHIATTSLLCQGSSILPRKCGSAGTCKWFTCGAPHDKAHQEQGCCHGCWRKKTAIFRSGKWWLNDFHMFPWFPILSLHSPLSRRVFFPAKIGMLEVLAKSQPSKFGTAAESRQVRGVYGVYSSSKCSSFKVSCPGRQKIKKRKSKGMRRQDSIAQEMNSLHAELVLEFSLVKTFKWCQIQFLCFWGSMLLLVTV